MAIRMSQVVPSTFPEDARLFLLKHHEDGFVTMATVGIEDHGKVTSFILGFTTARRAQEFVKRGKIGKSVKHILRGPMHELMSEFAKLNAMPVALDVDPRTYLALSRGVVSDDLTFSVLGTER